MSGVVRRSLLTSAFAVIAVGGYLAISSAGDGKIAPEELHRPSAMPDRIVLTWSDNPATTQSVTWRTDTSVTESVAQFAVSEDGPDFTGSSKKVDARSTRLTTNLGESYRHTADFTELTPDTLYAYRVGDGSNWSEWNQFRTATASSAPLTFLYFGDAQNNVLEHWSRVVRMAFTHAPLADFIIHAGDLINKGNSDAEWGEWYRASGFVHRMIPAVPTPGNHEYPKHEGKRAISYHWRPQFALPDNGPAGVEESCYYLDIQGVRVISLNSNELHAEQGAWLENVLADNPNRWTVLTFHHPIYSSARGRDNKRLREAWQPIFDKYAVDLVLQGHDHSYGRSNMVTGVGARTGNNGTVYVVSVSGPKQYQVDRQPWMARLAEKTQLFQVIRIDGDRLQYEARTARGKLYDGFVLLKQQDGPNQLINQIPEAPERFDDSGDQSEVDTARYYVALTLVMITPGV
ncbi:MAG: metallophosphoesterase family protein, partial [bacterium]|nr:metallophosphoesterase family protein [bacterium]